VLTAKPEDNLPTAADILNKIAKIYNMKISKQTQKKREFAEIIFKELR
jgi:hypothetical protein